MIASARRKWFGLALLLLVQFMVVLDIAIVNVALPSIKIDLGFSQENLQWVISAYALFFGGFLLLGGRASRPPRTTQAVPDRSRPLHVRLARLGLAWGESPLIGARAMQGLGAAIITPAALSILMTTFAEGKERNAALGAWGGVGAFGAVAGVLLGGVLTDLLSWNWIFFVNVPVGILALVARPVPDQREPRRDSRELRRARGRPGHERPRDAGLRHHAGQPLRLGLGHDDRPLRSGRRTARWVPGLGGPSQGSADAVLDLPAAHARRREHRRIHPGNGPVRDVPDAHPLHAAGARLLGDEDRRRLPGRGRLGDRDVRHRGAAGEPGRRQARAHRRDGRH